MNRNRRAILVGAAIVLPSWVVLRGIPAAIDNISLREASLAQRLELLSRYHEAVASLPSLDDSIRSFNEVASALSHTLLVGPDEGTAAVDLMRRTRELVSSRRATLIEFDARRAEESSGPLALAVVNATIETDFIELLELISEVEDDPALAIESFDIRAADPHAADTVPERLVASLGISGWYRPSSEEVISTPLHAMAEVP